MPTASCLRPETQPTPRRNRPKKPPRRDGRRQPRRDDERRTTTRRTTPRRTDRRTIDDRKLGRAPSDDRREPTTQRPRPRTNRNRLRPPKRRRRCRPKPTPPPPLTRQLTEPADAGSQRAEGLLPQAAQQPRQRSVGSDARHAGLRRPQPHSPGRPARRADHERRLAVLQQAVQGADADVRDARGRTAGQVRRRAAGPPGTIAGDAGPVPRLARLSDPRRQARVHDPRPDRSGKEDLLSEDRS